MTDIIQELRELIAKATPGPWEHMEGRNLVRAIRGDVAVPIFETMMPWHDPAVEAETVRVGGEVLFRANSEGARMSAASKREWSNAALVAAMRTHIEALLDRLEEAERGVDFLDMRRPIKGIECRSNEEVFAIMADRIRLAEAGHYRLPAIQEVKP